MKNTKNYIVIISIFYSLTLNLSIYANEFVVFRVDTSKNYLKISNTVSNHVLHSLRDSDSNYVYLSTDNGQNWALVFKEKRVAYLPYLANIEKLLIVSENSFLLSYDQGFVLVTTDKGNSWRQQIPDSTFVNANAYNAFVYNDNAYLYHHSRLFQADNQFTSWNQIKEPFGIDLKSTFWHIALTKSGYMFCTKYNLVDTTVQYLRVFLENDEPEEFNLPQYMNRYYFIDKDVGWSFHKTPYGDQHPPINYNIIYKTDDGGKNWIKQLDTTAIFLSFMGIKFFNHNIGYAYGYNSLLYFTDDGGINWKQLFPEFIGSTKIGFIVDITILTEDWALLNCHPKLVLLQRQTSGSFELIDDLSNKTDGYIIHKENNLTLNYEFDVKSMELFTLTGQSTPSLLRFTQSNNVITVTFPDNLSSGLYFLLLDTSQGKRFVRVIIAD